MKFSRTIFLVLLCAFAVSCRAQSDLTRRSDVDQFIDAMVKQHDFSRAYLFKIFRQVKIHPEIIDTITRPAESKPWYAYRALFVTKDRISGGVAYWKANAAALAAALKERDLLRGRSIRQAPDVDGQVYITAGQAEIGDIVPLRITDSSEYDLIGEIAED